MRIMLVEDSTPMRGIIRAILTQLGHDDVVEAADGEGAWAHLQQGHFDLLLTDWNMPRVSGLELLQRVRATAELRYLPVVMLTTRSNKEDIVSAIRAGVDNYVTKPCKPSQLKEKMDKAVLQEALKQAKGGGPVATAEQVLRECRKYHPTRRGPYVLFFESSGDMEALGRGQEADLLPFYSQILEILARLNAEDPAIELGYSIEQDTKNVARLVRGQGSRVLLLMVSVRTPEGLSLARMLGARRDPGLPPVHALCDGVTALDPSARDSLAHSGVELSVRSQLVQGQLESLLRQALAAARPTDLPAPPDEPHEPAEPNAEPEQGEQASR